MTRLRVLQLVGAVVVVSLLAALPVPQWIRYVNAGLYLASFWTLGSNLVRRWHEGIISRRTARVGSWLYATLGLGAYASTYAAWNDFPLSRYVLINTGILIGLAIALLIHPEDDDLIPPRRPRDPA